MTVPLSRKVLKCIVCGYQCYFKILCLTLRIEFKTFIYSSPIMTDIYFGGIEGGASRSTAVIYNGLGSKVSEATGLGTNHWMCGMEECQHRIFTLIQECKMKAKIPIKQPLAALGLSLSGCEQEATNTELKNSLKKSYPFLSKSYYVCSDTIAPIAAANEKGGIVVISGTGSNALLMNPDGSVIQSGGWGHLLGDEGSAYWVAWKAVKIVYDEADGFVDPPNDYSTTVIWELIKSYFNIESRFDILPYLYANFEKAKVAGLCKEIAQAAVTGDPLSKWLFQEAGHLLARFVLALAAKSDSAVFDDEHGLRIVCVGSMWKSWETIKVGFHAELETNTKKYTMKRLALLNLTVKVAVGAVYLAAKSINYDLPRNYKDNFSVFYQYKRRQ